MYMCPLLSIVCASNCTLWLSGILSALCSLCVTMFAALQNYFTKIDSALISDYICFLLQSKINLELTYTTPVGSGKGGDRDTDEDEAWSDGDIEGEAEGGGCACSAFVSQMSVLTHMFQLPFCSTVIQINAFCHSTVIRPCHSNLSIQMLHHLNVLLVIHLYSNVV